TSTVASNVGIPIFFNDTSDGYPTSWYWDFGDGTISTTKNNSYAYASTGTYTVKFRVTNGVETSWKNETNLITISGALPPAPIVDFEAIPVSASLGSAIQFYDLSGNAPSSWAWEFGDGSTSTLKNPSHTYAATGSYTVNLTATNSGGSDTESKTGYITITTLPPPTAAFSASSTLTYVGGTVSFTDESTGSPTSWSWNFGDGTTSSLRNPGHSYTSAGTYTVILTATNVYGSDVLTKPAYITVEAVPPTIPPTSYVITNPATGTTNNAVTMNGYTAATTYKYHFEYGLKSSTYSYSTKPKDGVAGNFSVTVEGLPLLPDETYYFRAVIQDDGEYVSGNELTYLTSPDSGIDSYPEFEEREEALIESNWEFEKLLEVIPSPFVDTMGNIFWGIIFGGAFFILWARTHKIVIPAIFGIISGGMLWNIMPPSWIAFVSAMFYLSIAALVYWIILGRQS
ncbi:MAG: PKD domain-containing protein, partial [Candidatus Marinimicrobia bacterium]|nr:PKD domain-containing protein [Candidatus Neomarinimicrobiota bacterium]